MRRLLVVLAALALLVALAPAATAHHVNEGNVRFKVTCDYSHSGRIDPIVFPGQSPAGHRHDFFGNVGVNANTTTYAQLRASTTNCNNLLDEAAYWAPSMRSGSNPFLVPTGMTVYYRLGEKHAPITPYPAGLKVIAGDLHETPGVQNGTHFGYKCEGDQSNGLGQHTPPATCPGNEFIATVEFPDCWDGVNLDSANHRSHMAYSIAQEPANVCPSTHPVPVPEATYFIHYITSLRPITLTSGGTDSLHADLFNGWDEVELARLVDECLNAYVRCDSGA